MIRNVFVTHHKAAPGLVYGYRIIDHATGDVLAESVEVYPFPEAALMHGGDAARRHHWTVVPVWTVSTRSHAG